MDTKQLKQIGNDLIGLAQDYEDTEDKSKINDLNIDLDLIQDRLNRVVA